MYLWQQRQINAPAVITQEHDLDTHSAGILKVARQKLEDMVKANDIHKCLGCETFIVKKIGYKSNSSLRNEKALQGIRQLERSLKRLLEVDPTTIVKPLLDCFPSLLTLHHGGSVYLPSRQMLEHALVRIVGCVALLHQIVNRAVLTYIAAVDQIAIGMQTKNMLVFAAASSRVWYLCRSLKVQFCASYGHLLPLLDVLKPTKAPWLNDGFQFPADLQPWVGKELGMPKSVEEDNTHVAAKNTSEIDSQMMVNTQIVTVEEAPKSNIMMEDLGEAIIRTQIPTPKSKEKENVLSPKRAVISVIPGTPRSKTVSTPTTKDPMPLAILAIWNAKIEGCKTRQDLVEVMKSFQKTFQIKSKRIKVCCRELKSSSGTSKSPAAGCKKADKKRCKACLKKVAKLHVKAAGARTDGVGDRREETSPPVKHQAPSGLDYRGNEALAACHKNTAISEGRFDGRFVRLLRIKMLRANGVKETLRELNDDARISAASHSWTIPDNRIAKLKRILMNCLRGMKGVSREERKESVISAAKHIRTALCKDKANQTVLTDEDGKDPGPQDATSKKPPAKQTGKSKKSPKKNRAKPGLAANDKESKHFTVKRTMVKKQGDGQIHKQAKGKKNKASKGRKHKGGVAGSSSQNQRKDSNNNTGRKMSKRKRRKKQ